MIEDKILDILIIILLLVIIISPILAITFIKTTIDKVIYIKELEQQVNTLKFEKEYLEYAYEDSLNQRY